MSSLGAVENDPAAGPVPDRAWRAFLAVGLATVGGYALLPAGGTAAALVHAVVNGAAVIAVALGIRQRPFATLAWRLVLTALVAQFILNALNLARLLEPGLAVPEEAIAAGFLVPYAMLAAAFVAYAVARGSPADRTALLDAAIIVVGIAVGLFLLATQSVAQLDGFAIAERTDAVSAFFLGVPPLVLGLWLLLTPGAWAPAIGLLTLGVAVQSLGDAIFGLGPWLPTSPRPEPVWLASLVVLGAAALHPSVGVRAGAGAPALLRGSVRFTLLGVAILVATLGDAPQHLLYDRHRPIEFAIVSAVVVVLAVVRLGGLLREVDERRAEEAMSRAFAEELVATSPGIVVRGRVPGAVLTYASPALVRVLGYRPEDVVNVPGWWPDVVHPDDLGTFPSILGDGGATVGRVAREARVRHTDGTYRNLFIQSEITRAPDGGPDMFVGTVLDVTDWRAAQSGLAVAKGYLDDVIESTPVVFLRGRGPGLVLDYLSPNVEAVLGYRAGELIGRPDWLVTIVHPDDHVTTETAIAASAARREERYTTDLRCIAADGQTRAMYVIIRRAFADDGTWMFTGTLLDITERKATEEALQQAKDEAERANQAKGEFLSGVSHELRTPLNAVLGFGQLLEQSPLAPQDRASVEQILKGGRRLLGMLEGVLDLTRVDAGRLTLSIEPVDVDEVVHDAADLVRPGAFEHGVTIALPPRSQPAAFVSADRQRLKQVLHNLLSNAAKYSPDGAAVEVTVATGSTAGRWRISVRDTGPGVPAELQPRLFQPFERSTARAPAGGGLGVGLALSARLVRLMAGTIGVDSVPGAGSTFWVELPAADEPREPAADAAGSAQAGAPGPPGGRTVVYIEDNLANLGLVERLLAGRPGTRLLAAMQGRLGLELVRRQAVDLVLLDLQLPDLPGEELLNHLRADERTRSIPVLILSSNDDPRARARLSGLGADGYLDKPLDVVDFLRQVDRLLEEGRADA